VHCDVCGVDDLVAFACFFAASTSLTSCGLNCSARRRLLAFTTDRHSIRAILAHLGLPTELPTIAPARAPPRPALPFA
jgi:hypothetical protein